MRGWREKTGNKKIGCHKRTCQFKEDARLNGAAVNMGGRPIMTSPLWGATEDISSTFSTVTGVPVGFDIL